VKNAFGEDIFEKKKVDAVVNMARIWRCFLRS